MNAAGRKTGPETQALPEAPPCAGPEAGLLRRLASLAYEALLLFAVLFIADLAFLLLVPGARTPALRPALQLYLLLVMGIYFTWFWTHGGQTVAMKAWRLRLVSATGGRVSWRRAIARYLFAVAGAVVLDVLWALVDRDRQFLHDRLAGTRIVRV